MPIPEKRGKILRYRTKELPGNKYLVVAVTSKKGPRGGRTVAHVRKKKKRE
jgi:hypothetical protein